MQILALVVQITFWGAAHSFVHLYLLSTKYCAKKSEAHKDTEPLWAHKPLYNVSYDERNSLVLHTIAISELRLKVCSQYACLQTYFLTWWGFIAWLSFICLFSFRNLFIFYNLVHKHKQNVRLTNREVSKVWWHSENKLHYRSMAGLDHCHVGQ